MKPIYKIWTAYVLLILFMLIAGTSFSQVQIAVFNAEWNEANKVEWVHELKDVNTLSYIDVSKDTELQKKHKIAVVPTIIIFKDDEEVARFQADLSFKIISPETKKKKEYKIVSPD